MGRNHLSTFQVMRRLLTTKRNTDCTCYTIYGRRNRYARAALTAMEMLGGIRYAVRQQVPKSGNDRAFPFYYTGAGQMNSSFSVGRVTFCFAPVFLCPAITCGFWEKSKKICKNKRKVYFSTFMMYLANQTMPRLLMRTYIQMLSSVKCRLTSSALFF